jgi:serine/threonine protein kinase
MASLSAAGAAVAGADVRRWCDEHRLASYADAILDGGFDTMEDVRDMDEDDLLTCGVAKPGHRKRALVALAALRARDSPASLLEPALARGEAKSADRGASANVLNIFSVPLLLTRLRRELDAINDGRWIVVKYLGGCAPSSPTANDGKSAVVLATDSRLGQVAIKAVPVGDDRTRQRFVREMAFLQRVAHTNIVRCLADPFASADGTLMFGVLEMLPGGSLRTIREGDEAGRLGEEYVVQLAVDVLRGLAHSHDQGVVHKDLKCDNIMSGGEGFKIVDFGIAHMDQAHRMAVSNTMLTQTTRRISAIGTPHYMSPEQYRNQTISFPTDIWSIGVVMYRNLVGRFPFGDGAASLAEITVEVLTKEVDDRIPDASPDISRIICKALQKDPAQRYASANAMLADLTPLLETKPLPPGCKWHFFICKHDAAGAQSAMNICHELRARGFKVWISNDIEGPNTARMREGVRESAMFLLYLTKRVFSREWCRDVEMLEAVQHRKPFVLLRCKKGEHEFTLGNLEAELSYAGAAFRPVGELLFRQCEAIDWSLNATTRPAIVERLEREYAGRAEMVSSFYDGADGLDMGSVDTWERAIADTPRRPHIAGEQIFSLTLEAPQEYGDGGGGGGESKSSTGDGASVTLSRERERLEREWSALPADAKQVVTAAIEKLQNGGSTDFELAGNNISDAGVVKLCEVLPQCAALLEKLDLRSNLIGDAGAQALAVALPQCARLQALDLDRNQIGDAGAQALAAALPQCASLQKLYLRSNHLTDASMVSSIIPALPLSSLTSLYLYSQTPPLSEAVLFQLRKLNKYGGKAGGNRYGEGIYINY